MAINCEVQIGSQHVIASGTIITKNDAKLKISNILGLDEIYIYLEFDFHSDTSINRTESYPIEEDENGVKIVISRYWNDKSNHTSNDGLFFLENGINKYYFAHDFSTSGSRDDYLVTLHFVILSELSK